MSDLIDPVDRGCKTEADLRDDALEAQRRRANLEGKTAEDSAEACRVCDKPLTLKRRRAYPGTDTCVPCQTELESALHQYRRH